MGPDVAGISRNEVHGVILSSLIIWTFCFNVIFTLLRIQLYPNSRFLLSLNSLSFLIIFMSSSKIGVMHNFLQSFSRVSQVSHQLRVLVQS